MQSYKMLNKNELNTIAGGKTKYYGNGVYCNSKKCWVDWSKAIGIIGNNAAANLATGGKAGWNNR